MKKVTQRVEKFYGHGTLGAEDGTKTLESIIFRMNREGWRVDQIVPTSFRAPKVSVAQGMDMTSGIILCSQIE